MASPGGFTDAATLLTISQRSFRFESTGNKQKTFPKKWKGFFIWRPQGDSNPRRRRERAVSWARLDDRDLKYQVPAEIESAGVT